MDRIPDSDMARLRGLQRLIENEGGYSACALNEAIHWADVGPELLAALEALLDVSRATILVHTTPYDKAVNALMRARGHQ